mmetsp:Transcript_53602/g.123223  ORF Transcript_53602/g.123223 Transcript_53602/m.123223 type:complete len:595 (-) Transcript_53602:91-1875(-)
MEKSEPLDFLIEELSSENAQQCVTCISRLRVIALALGQAKTRSDLIPYLTHEIEQDKFTDEVQVSIAEVLGSFVEFVGGVADAHCLFPPLVALCSVEESTVRDQAVASINQVGKQLSNAQVQGHLVPTVLKLARTSDWFTPRVSACGLFALAYKASVDGVNDTAQGKELSETFCKSLGIDDSPMVRRAAAIRLSELAKELSAALIEEDLLPLHRTLLADEQESVRVNALRGCASVCSRISAPTQRELLEKDFKKCVQDKSWRVRIACAEVISDVAKVCSGSPECASSLQGLYESLQLDHEPEVRVAAALKAAGVAESLGAEFSKDTIFPVVSGLARDPNAASRVELATVLMNLAKPIGKEAALTLLLPVIPLLTEDENTNVRLAVINCFDSFIGVVGLSEEREQESLLRLIKSLASDKNWRVRHAILLLLPVLAQELGLDGFAKHLGQSLETHATDHYALIREDFVKRMAMVSYIPGFGASWLETNVVKILIARAKDKNYQMRSVLLLGVEHLHAALSQEVMANDLIPLAVEMATDKVPNLRIQAVRSLAAAAPSMPEHLNNTVILPKLRDQTEDEDMDVKFFAEEALSALGAS